MANKLYDGDTFTVKGIEFTLAIKPNGDNERPWDNSDGHGFVREAEVSRYTGHITKSPGERVLHVGDRGCYNFVYDWAGAMVQAKRDGWGVAEENRPANWGTLTEGERRVIAVQSDFDYLASWCSGDWEYVGVKVTSECGESEALWGIESCAEAYLTETAYELAGCIAKDILKEAAEVAYWATRDVVTA